jgi:hypothetical protein
MKPMSNMIQTDLKLFSSEQSEAQENQQQYSHQRELDDRAQKKKTAVSLVRTDAKALTLDKFLNH